MTKIQLRQFMHGQRLDAPLLASDTIKDRIVRNHRHAVSTGVHVSFEVGYAQSKRVGEREQRIFGGFEGKPSMRKHARPRRGEVGQITGPHAGGWAFGGVGAVNDVPADSVATGAPPTGGLKKP